MISLAHLSTSFSQTASLYQCLTRPTSLWLPSNPTDSLSCLSFSLICSQRKKLNPYHHSLATALLQFYLSSIHFSSSPQSNIWIYIYFIYFSFKIKQINFQYLSIYKKLSNIYKSLRSGPIYPTVISFITLPQIPIPFLTYPNTPDGHLFPLHYLGDGKPTFCQLASYG